MKIYSIYIYIYLRIILTKIIKIAKKLLEEKIILIFKNIFFKFLKLKLLALLAIKN